MEVFVKTFLILFQTLKPTAARTTKYAYDKHVLDLNFASIMKMLNHCSLAFILCKEEDRENSANISYRVMILLILSRREGAGVYTV
jgi:hypothetical protein